jgi:pyrroline-5-carboxylate reductase
VRLWHCLAELANRPTYLLDAGYIGGAILTSLLSHPDASSFTITAIVRDAAKAARLKAEFGVRGAVGSHNDRALVEPLAYESDVVITAADVDDMEAAQAILDGMKRRKDETGVASLLIHTVPARRKLMFVSADHVH